jgi:hypothetical protein
MSLLPRCFRFECGNDPAAPATAVRPLPLPRFSRCDRDLRQCHHSRTRRYRSRADRTARRGGRGGRITAGGTHDRVVGARVAHRSARRERRAGASFRGRRRRPNVGRPGGAGRANAGLRAVAARGRTDSTRRPSATGGHSAAPAGHGGLLPCRLSRRRPPRDRTGTVRRGGARTGHHQCPGIGYRHRRVGRRAAGRIPGNGDLVLAAGGPMRSAG